MGSRGEREGDTHTEREAWEREEEASEFGVIAESLDSLSRHTFNSAGS